MIFIVVRYNDEEPDVNGDDKTLISAHFTKAEAIAYADSLSKIGWSFGVESVPLREVP